MNNKFTDGMLNFAGKLQGNRWLGCIRDAFTYLMPIIIIGSFCTLFANVICNTTPGYMSLANVPHMGWLGALRPIFTTANYGTMSMIAIGIAILLSQSVAESYGNHDKVVSIVSLASFISLCGTTMKTTAEKSGEEVTVANVLASKYTAATGLFVAMFVAIFATKLYIRFTRNPKLKITMPDSVPPSIARSFEVLFPATFTVLIISCVGWAFSTFVGMTLFDAITKFIQAPLKNAMTGLPGYCLILFCQQLLWFFGIHGSQTLSGITSAPLLAAFAENEQAYAAGDTIPNIISTPFVSTFAAETGAGITGGLILAIMLFSKRDDYKAIAKLAIPCGIFNINEPIIFGIPMVMNPLFAIPFFLCPIASVVFGYWMTAIGFCPKMVVNAPWTTPPGIEAFLASGGSWKAAVTQLLAVAIAFLIYTPFVLMSNKQKPAGEETAE